MFVQVPIVFNNLLVTWVNKVKKEFGNVVEIEYQKGDTDITSFCSAFRLRKTPRSPEKLPLLAPRIVKRIPKYITTNERKTN